MVAIDVLLELQFDCAVMFWSAVNRCVPPTVIEGLIGAMSMPVRVPPEELLPHPKETRLKEAEEHWQECAAVSVKSEKSSGGSKRMQTFPGAIRMSGRRSNVCKATTSILLVRRKLSAVDH
jgi:hypothetical protein